MILIPQSVVYRGTITGLRISSVDGTAFLDACAALVPYADGNHLVEIYPSVGGALGLKGYLKAQGSAETLGSNLLDGFDFTSGWMLGETGSVVDSNSFSSTGVGGLYKSVVVASGLFKIVAEYSTSASSSRLESAGIASTYLMSSGTVYKTTNDARIYFRNYSAGQTDVTKFEIYQVLTPSTDGVTIVSTKSGAVPNFASKNASFTYNAEKYTVIVRKVR